MQKKGISLIVLVITIIVMIILAAAVVISLTSNGIIDRANQAVQATDEKQVQQIVSLAWADAYTSGRKTLEELQAAVDKSLEENNIDTNQFYVEVTTTGVNVTKDVPYVYKNTKYVISKMEGSYIIVSDDGTINMYDRADNVINTIPSVCVSMEEKTFTIGGTGTEYDNIYGTLLGGQYLCVISGNYKYIAAHKQGTCDHKRYIDEVNNIDSGSAWRSFYDSEMNLVNIGSLTSIEQLKECTLRCDLCFAEIPFRIYDDSDYVYIYNSIMEPQLNNSKYISGTSVDCCWHQVNGWVAIPFDCAKTNNLYSEIEGEEVKLVFSGNGGVIPKTVKYIYTFLYHALYDVQNLETIEYTYLGTKSEYMATRANLDYELSAYENIKSQIEYYNQLNSVVIHCTDGDIVITK